MTTGTKYRILVVDDAKLNVDLMCAYLGDAYDLITAFNGKDALHKVKSELPDLILLDVMMPGMDGYEVCRVIRKEYQIDFIPIILVTALSSKDDQMRGLEVGADDFLTKPVSKFELDRKVSSLLRIKKQHDTLLVDRNKAYRYLDYVSILIAVMDMDYNIVHINKKGLDLLGYNAGSIMHKNWINTFAPESYYSKVKAEYDELTSGSREQHVYHEYPLNISTGEERTFLWYDTLLRDDEGNITGILMSGEDITERKKAQEKLQEYAHELERSNELKELFNDIMRHDLLNPAGIVRSFGELLAEKETDPYKLNIIENILKATNKVIDMVEGTAHLAKLEHTEELSLTRMELVPLIKETVSNFSREINNKELDVKFDFDVSPSSTYPALANPMIERVFINLTSNAVKYTSRESSITIKIDDAGDKWRISFIDCGDGIPDKDKHAIFERFKRLHKDSVRGTGLGLAIVKRIMELHKEQIGVLDNPDGRGSMFWLTLKKAR